jgi:hypothetical protein
VSDHDYLLSGEPTPVDAGRDIDCENEIIAHLGYKAFRPKREAFVPTDEDFQRAARDIGPSVEGYEREALEMAQSIRQAFWMEQSVFYGWPAGMQWSNVFQTQAPTTLAGGEP